jgi:hypothetical protein
MSKKYTRAELEAALRVYNAARDQACRTGDWNVWADLFTEDAEYIEHAYGTFQGREKIREWITKVMAPFPSMTFPQDWVAFDEDNGAILFQCQNRLPHPTDPNGPPFQFPNWTRLVYAGNGKFTSEEDVYNPAREAHKTVSAWLAAGGKLAASFQVDMAHGG